MARAGRRRERQLKTIISRGVLPGLDSAAQAAGQLVLRTGEGFCSADIARDRRFGTGADGAAVAGAAVACSRAAAGRLGR